MIDSLRVADAPRAQGDFAPSPLAPADAAAAAALIRAAFAAQPRPTSPPSSALRETADSVAAKIAAGGGFGVVSDDRLCAVALWLADDDALMIGRVCVLPDQRGRGLSLRLIAACESAARSRGLARRGFERVSNCRRTSVSFTRMGFARIRVEAHAGHDAPTVAVLEKALA